jgi:predicted nucleic-acid-binding protein
VIALDTNILARYYVAAADERDGREQEMAATVLSSERSYFVSIDVALELAWVLIGPYGCSPQQVRRVFNHLAALPNVTLEQAEELIRAADWHVEGLDFADALHLARSTRCPDLLTLDRRFVQRAKKLGLSPRVSLPGEA